MNKFVYIFVIILSVVVFASSSPAIQCAGENFDDLQNRINVDPCGKSSCKMPRYQNTTVTFRFKTDSEVNQLTNDVYAVIGIPLPFLGVHGTNACGNIVHASDGTPAPCPLKANTEYIYTNAFYIEPFYPTVTMRVHWGLKSDNKHVICFEIPAKIVDKKKK